MEDAAVREGFDRATVERLAELWEGPEWLRRRRQQAWELFRSLPLPPPTHEAWRRTPPERLAWDGLGPVLQERGDEVARQGLDGLRGDGPALALHNGAVAGSWGAERLRRAGV
ncbi:MAG: hypothetical protein QN116_02650, partial [Armatimonadota bacterium]|nr:hypothetical protein [Armatimonadota bacterium]